MHPKLAVLAAAQGGVFTRRQADEAGYTRAQISHRLSSRRWVVVGYGVYAEHAVFEAAQADHHARHAMDTAAALLRAEAGAAASHTSAARLYRVHFIGGWPVAPTITVPPAAGTKSKAKRTRILDRRVAQLPERHVTAVDGIGATAPARTLIDVARELTFAEGVVVADDMRGRDLVQQPALDEVLTFCRLWPGIETARRVVAFADPRAESPLESYGRAVLHEHGAPRFEPQVWLYDERGVIGRVDGYVEEFFTVVEFDGLVKYTESDALHAEKLRQERLEEAGFGVARVTKAQLEREPERTAGRVWSTCRRTLRRRADAGPGEFTGYVGPVPDWWSDRGAKAARRPGRMGT